MGAVLLISLYVTRAALIILGAEDYGLYNVVCGFVTLFGALNLSLSTCINRFYNYEIGKGINCNLKIVYNTALLIQFLIAILLVLFLETAGLWYLNNKMVIPEAKVTTANIIYHISVASLAFTVMQAPFTAAVLSFEKMDFYAIVSIIDVFLKLAIVFFLPIEELNTLLMYAILLGLISIINFLIYYIYCKAKFKQLVLSFKYKKDIFKSMLSFIGWNFLDPISYNVRGQGCNILLNSFFGPITNAAYTISNQVASALDTFTVSISTAFRPQLIQSYAAENYQRSTNLMLTMSKIMYCLYLMISLPVIFGIGQILDLWLVDYPKIAINFTIFILVVKQLNVLNPALSTSIMATGDIKRYTIISSTIICSIIPFSYITLRLTNNPDVVYYWMMGLTVINQLFCIKITCKQFKGLDFKLYASNVLIPCVIQTFCLLPIVSMVLLLPGTIYRIFISFILSIIGSIFVFYNFTLRNEEKKIVRDYILKISNKIILCK